jgi:uncharacterized membrane protein
MRRVPEEPSDFERLIGPDRRPLPHPSGLAWIVIGIAFSTVIGIVILLPREKPELDLSSFGFAGETVSAVVDSAEVTPCSYAEDLDCRLVGFAVSSASGEQTEFTQEFSGEAGEVVLVVGERVFLSVVRSDDHNVTYTYYDRDRRVLLGVVALLFGLAVVGLGRMRGLAALAGLALSLVVLISFIVPAIVAGRDAVLVALVGGSAIVLIALYLANGFTAMTHVSAIGAFAALALTVILSWLVLTLARFTGLASEESFYLLSLPDIDLSGLLLAGVVLGTIGVLDDVTVTQASAVWELQTANPRLGHRGLFDSGLRIGRDHIASTVNTLLLAYAGAGLPLVILFSLSGLPLGVVASSEVIAVEIARTLIGSIGLVAAVPITTWLAARQASTKLAEK